MVLLPRFQTTLRKISKNAFTKPLHTTRPSKIPYLRNIPSIIVYFKVYSLIKGYWKVRDRAQGDPYEALYKSPKPSTLLGGAGGLVRALKGLLKGIYGVP